MKELLLVLFVSKVTSRICTDKTILNDKIFDSVKIVGYMYDFKSEVEQYTGKKIDMNKSIDQAQKEARSRGQKIDDRYIKQIKKGL